MSKHDEKTESTKVESVAGESSEASDQVFEGEVVTESIDDKMTRGRAYSASKAPKNAGSDKEKSGSDTTKADPKASAKVTSWRDKIAKFLRYGMWLAIVAAVIAVFIFTRPNTDWQVQHINDLQTEVAQLHQANKTLEGRLNTQEEVINQRVTELVQEAMLKPENQSVVTKADLETIQTTSEQQILKLQENLTSLTDQVTTQLDKAVTNVADFAEANQEVLKPTEEQLAALKQLEEKVQSQLSEMGGKLSELFDYQSNQAAQPKAMELPSESNKLTVMQIQKWIVELNTEWLFKGNSEMTKQQLLALEHAVSVSQIKRTNSLILLLGQDLAYLEQYKTDALAKPTLDTSALRQAVNELTVVSSTPSTETSSESTTAPSSETMDSDSALEQLKSRLGDMIRITKRDDEAGQTKVESLLMQDVLVQRTLLLVDRIDWAIQSQSESVLKVSVKDLQQFIEQNFTAHSVRFKDLLKPFSEMVFVQRKSLAITQFQVSE